MSKLYKIWNVLPVITDLKQLFMCKLGITDVIAQVLINRGFNNENLAKKFIECSILDIEDPFKLKDMNLAINRIVNAINFKQKITIYGDYDVDGITATTLIYKVLIDLDAVVDYYIPDRQKEGYGLNIKALEYLISSGVSLVITVDCGINAVNEVEAKKEQLDIIITDHHEPQLILPNAYAIINPKQKECVYPEKQLTGVGVIFKLCQALLNYFNKDIMKYTEYFELVAIGTIADIASLRGENRILVKYGLKALKNSKNIGLKALMTKCNISNKEIDTQKVGFIIAPRLNAAGRISHAKTSVEILITNNIDKAKKLAEELESNNNTRQLIEKIIYEKVQILIKKINLENENVIVLMSNDWHLGVIGIVASKILEKYYKPVILFVNKNGIAKGSCRSIPNFDIYKALEKCKDLLLNFGGHKAAAGLSIKTKFFYAFKKRINDIAKAELTKNDYVQSLKIDSYITIDKINSDFVKQFSCLEPFGKGNPIPVFACKSVYILEVKAIGKNKKHLKMKIKGFKSSIDVIAWNQGEIAKELNSSINIALAFSLEFNEWQGFRKVQLRAHDLRYIVNAVPLQLF